MIWRLFKRKRGPKAIRHELRHVCTVPAHKDFYRAVKCINCDKQFIMDVFGGWAVEWTFETEGTWKVKEEDLVKGITYFHSKSVREWTQLGYTNICHGTKAAGVDNDL